MACKINRNSHGDVQTVYQENGEYSELFDQINTSIGLDSEVALVAYLDIIRKARSRDVEEKHLSLDTPIVKQTLDSVRKDSLSWENASEALKREMLEGRVGESLEYLFEKLGVDINIVKNLRDVNGNLIDQVAAADIANRMIEMTVEGSTIANLSEEAAHFMVEILRAQGHPLYDSMARNVRTTEIYKELMDPNSVHYNLYNGNEDMIAREAMGKLIANELIKGGTNESKQFKSRLERWFDKVMSYINSIFGRAHTDPFVKAAHQVLNKDLHTLFTDMSSTQELESAKFYNEGTRQENILKKLEEEADLYEIREIDVNSITNEDLQKYFHKVSEDGTVERYVGIPGTKYEGNTLKKRSSDAASIKFNKYNKNRYITPAEEAERQRINTIRTNMGTKGHKVLEELLKKFTGVSKRSDADILSESGPMFTKEQFSKLKQGVKFLVNEIKDQQASINAQTKTEGKFKLITEQFVSDEKNDTGGTIDVLVIYSDGSGSVYDWKFKSPTRNNATFTRKGANITGDMYASSLDGYDAQIGSYRDALLEKYGVTKLNHSRIIPISVVFKTDDKNRMVDSISQVQMWTGVDTDNRFLEHIPVAMELTSDESINRLIKKEMSRFNMLASKLEHANYSDKEMLRKRMSDSRLIIKRLQLDQEISAGLVEAFRIIKKVNTGLGVENEFIITEDGEEIHNPDYLTDSELNEAYTELQHFLGFSTLPDIKERLQKSKSKSSDKLLEEMSKSSFEISNAIEKMSAAMVQRIDIRAKARGIKNIKYNRRGTVEAWIPSSAHKSPYSRYITQVMNEMKVSMISKEKALAAEIYEYEENLFEWGQANGYNNIDVFDVLINSETHNLHPKYKSSLYEARDTAIKNRNVEWMKEHYTVDMEYYNKSFLDWRTRAFKNIENTGSSVAAKKIAWEKKYDVLKYSEAWLDDGGRYFTKLDETKTQGYITSEYRTIMKNEPVKAFYEFHQKKIYQFEKQFGTKLGPTFIANVKKTAIDSILEADNKGKALSEAAYDMFHVTESDMSLGSIDIEGNFVREIPRLFTRELRNSKDEVDRSLRSKELGRSLYLLGKAAMEYEYLTDVKDDLLLLETILNEGMLGEVQEDDRGKSVKESFDTVKAIFGVNNKAAGELFTDQVEQALFKRNLKSEDKVTKSGLSANRMLLGAKTFHSISALGLKVPVALGAFGAGIVGLHIQASKGIHFNNQTLKEAESAILGRDPKVRAIMEHFELAILDVSKRRGDNLASNWRSKYLTQDRWFEFLAQADKTIDAVLATAMSKNHAYDENGNLKRLDQLPEGTLSLFDTIEVQENEKYKHGSPLDRYVVSIPGETKAGFGSFRDRVHIMSGKVKGTSSPEAITTAKQKLLNRFFMHYRSWLPGIALERFGKTKYDHIMESWDEGTWRTLNNNFGPDVEFDSVGQVLDVEVGMHEYLMAVGADLVTVALDAATFGLIAGHNIKENKARQSFEEFLIDNVGNADYTYETKEEKEEAFEEFLKMKQGNIRAIISEIRAVLLLGLMMGMASGDWDDDNKIDLRQTWAGRKLHNVMGRIYRETAVFVDPREMTGPRASGIPLLSLGGDLISLASNSLDETRDLLMGENSVRDSKPVGYVSFKFVPGANGIAKALEIYPQYKHARS